MTRYGGDVDARAQHPKVRKPQHSQVHLGRLRAALIFLGGFLGGVSLAAVGVVAVLARRFGRDDPQRYEDRVANIEALSSVEAGGAVLLTGSSYLEHWRTSARDLAPLRTINIGIGGTKVGDHLAHFERMVTPFAPKALVVYIGSNDISGIPFLSKSGVRTANLVIDYIERARRSLGTVPIYYIAITETPSRSRVRDEIQEANRILAERARGTGDFTFIDTAPSLLCADGRIDDSLFLDDRLHLNEKGYRAFAGAVQSGLAPEYVALEHVATA